MKQNRTPLRPAIAALFAAVALPLTPLLAQDVVAPAPPPAIGAPPPAIVAPPPVTTITPPPEAPLPAIVAPRPAITTSPAFVTPIVPRAAPAPAPQARAARAAPRATAAPVRARVAARPVAEAPAPTVEPLPVEPALAPAPVAATPPVPLPVETPVAPAETQAAGGSLLPWILAGAALLIAAFGFMAWRRRRAAAADYEDSYRQEPVAEAYVEPAIAAPRPAEPLVERPVADDVSIHQSDSADVEALAATSEPVAGRPWIEFLLRPLRAGTSKDDAIVQFELTVGNTGSAAATDVRISTWMVAATPGSEMERMLIEPPADASVSEVDIAAGDGTRVDGRIALSKTGLDESVLPVVMADARYTLPDGSEGRTSASFAVGVPEGDALAPFRTDRSSGLRENVEARLHGEPQRV